MATDTEYWAGQFKQFKKSHGDASRQGMNNMFGTPEPFHLNPHHHSPEAETARIENRKAIKNAKLMLKHAHAWKLPH